MIFIVFGLFALIRWLIVCCGDFSADTNDQDSFVFVLASNNICFADRIDRRV